MKTQHVVTHFLMGLAVAVSVSLNAIAGEFPTKPVRLIVGFPPGGATDLVARIIQPKLTELLGKQVIVDNRPGANGIISLDLLARAEPDGYTFGFGHLGGLVISPAIQKVPYDPFKSFAPIGLMVTLQNIIITHPSVPAKTLKEFIALAKSKQGQLNYASSGIGSPGHLAGELLQSMAGIQMTHIPYKGGGPAITDLLAGHVPAFFAVISTAVPHVQSGRVRAIAVTGDKRAGALPDVPTVGETVQGLRRNQLVRAGCARENAEGDHRPDQQGRRCSAQIAGSGAPAERPRHRFHPHLAGGIREVHSRRRQEVGAGHQAGEHQALRTRYKIN